MDDYIRRSDAINAMANILVSPMVSDDEYNIGVRRCMSSVDATPAADVRPVVYCRDCIHRPYSSEPGKTSGFAVEAPDRECKCPCFNPDDGWYSWIPDDYFFCGNGERREGGTP